MTESEIKELFDQVIKERGIHNKIGYSKHVVFNWRNRPGQEATFAVMLDVLYKLGLINVTKNE